MPRPTSTQRRPASRPSRTSAATARSRLAWSERIPARHAADQRRVRRHIPVLPHARSGLRVGRVARQVITVGDHRHAIAPIALRGMALGRILRRAHDGARHPARQEGAGAQHHPRRPAAAFQMRAGIAYAPGDRAHAGQTRGQAADQVGVIHPGLHRVGPLAGDQAPQGQEPAQADAAARHAQRMDLDAGGAQALAVDALIGQGDDHMLHRLVGMGGQTEQHRLGAALPQARDHVQHAAAGRSWPRSRTASNSASHSDSTLARA